MTKRDAVDDTAEPAFGSVEFVKILTHCDQILKADLIVRSIIGWEI
jgi:hypothetical protein